MSKSVLSVVAAAILRERADGRLECLTAQRPHAAPFGGYFEFPGGKVEPGETHEQALVREIQEELGVTVVVEAYVARGSAEHQEKVIELDVYFARLIQGEPRAHEHLTLSWLTHDALDTVNWAPADLPALEVVRAHLQNSP